MTTIEEKNKVIAEFMGRAGKINKHLYYVNVEGVNWVTIEEMKFHTSYDWIMPVVWKIENTEHITALRGHYVEIVGCTCKIEPSHGLHKDAYIKFTGGETKLLAIHEACYQFAVWYKENSQS
jgi:hypothetical protein